jgi:thioredoxin-like negative regulator of GroEL
MFGPSTIPSAQAIGVGNPYAISANQNDMGKIMHPKTPQEFSNIINQNKCVIVDFTSATCPPCRIISPEFERLIEDSNGKVVGVSVDVGKYPLIGMPYNVSATPTFISFLDGTKVNQIPLTICIQLVF